MFFSRRIREGMDRPGFLLIASPQTMIVSPKEVIVLSSHYAMTGHGRWALINHAAIVGGDKECAKRFVSLQ
jgi:hypothetical protein